MRIWCKEASRAQKMSDKESCRKIPKREELSHLELEDYQIGELVPGTWVVLMLGQGWFLLEIAHAMGKGSLYTIRVQST